MRTWSSIPKQARRTRTPSAVRRRARQSAVSLVLPHHRTAYDGCLPTADRNQGLVVRRGGIVAEGGDGGADLLEAIPCGGGVAVEQQRVEAVGAEEGALAVGRERAASFGDSVGIEEKEVALIEGD